MAQAHPEWLPCSSSSAFHPVARPLQHKQALCFPHTPSGPGVEPLVLPLRVPPLLPPTAHLSSPPCEELPASSPSGWKISEMCPELADPVAFHLEEMLHFSPFTQKNMVLSELVFIP